jgi:hypothetical protein
MRQLCAAAVGMPWLRRTSVGVAAVVELSEEFVEQMPGGGAVAVAVLSSAPVVLAGGWAVGGGGEGPDPAGGGESVVFDVAVSD